MANVNRPKAPQGYRTPPELLRAVERRFGRITFDAACTKADAVASHGYTWPEVDALARDWGELAGELFFANPPWAKAGQFARKCAEAMNTPYTRGLLNCQHAADTEWYDRYVRGKALVLVLAPRVPYLNPDGTPAFVDKRGKPLGINRPVMIAAYGFGEVGDQLWRWRE